MRKKISILIISLMSFFSMDLNAEFKGEIPEETAILEFPDHSESNWKEICRYVNTKEGMIEMIPLNQTIQNWSELIAIQYWNTADWDRSLCNLEMILEHIRKEIISSYPPDSVSWEIIENNKEGIIYEWILHKPYLDLPIQHDISRAFLTSSGFHRTGFTRKGGHMNPEEREKWVKLLRKNSSVVPFQEAVCRQGLSMVEKLQHSVSLGRDFYAWRMINHFIFEKGSSLVCYIPPTQLDPYVAECVEIVAMPNINSASLSKFFECEKRTIKKQADIKVRFDVLEHTPTEIIYYYCHPKDNLQLNAVVRTFLTDHGYYSFSYKKGLEGCLQNEEMMSWLKKLKTIRVEVPSNSKKFVL